MLSFCQVQILFLSFPIGVLDHLFNIFSYYQVFFSFLPECFPNSIILVPWLSCYTGGFIFFWFLKLLFLVFQPTRFSNVPCSSFLTECFQLCSSSLFSSFYFAQPLKVHGFTRLSKKQLSFTAYLPLPFPSGAILDLGTRSSRNGGVL